MSRITKISQLLRPARANQVLPAPAQVFADAASIHVGVSSDLSTSVTLATMNVTLPDKPILLVPDTRPGAVPTPTLIASAIDLFPDHRPTAIGVPPDLSAAWLERWQRLADHSGARVVKLGDAGWDRVDLSGAVSFLAYVDIPTEVGEAASVILLTASHGLEGCLGAWEAIVHPRSRVRALMSGTPGRAALSLTTSATCLFGFTVANRSVAAWASDPLAAELFALGVHRVNELEAGIEAPGPWEDDRVQFLVQRSLNQRRSSRVVLDATVTDNEAVGRVQRLAELLGSELTISIVGGNGERA